MVPQPVLDAWERFRKERDAWALMWRDLQAAAEENKLITDWYEAAVMNDEWYSLRGIERRVK